MTGPRKRYNALVIGAGPAGTTAAFILAAAGLKVALVDKARFPRSKVCAGLLTAKTLGLVRQVFGVDIRWLTGRRALVHQCRRYGIYRRQTKLFSGRLNLPFYFADRRRYDQLWVNAARRAGVVWMPRRTVTAVDPQVGSVTLDSTDTIFAGVIVAADGVHSRVRRMLFNTKRHRHFRKCRTALAVELMAPHPRLNPVQKPAALYFGYTDWGYAWSFPGAGKRTVGMCQLRTRSGGSILEDLAVFTADLGWHQHQLSGLKGYALPYGSYQEPPGIGRVMLVGDACGLADPLLGEGIYYAHQSGRLAAEAVLDTWPSTSDALAHYHKRLNRIVGSDYRRLLLLRNLLFAGGRKRRLRPLEWFLSRYPKQVEAALQGHIPFTRLMATPWRPIQDEESGFWWQAGLRASRMKGGSATTLRHE